jgi:hypothetical protein
MADFGTDTLCLDSRKTGQYAFGGAIVGQRAYHRLTTPRGALRGGEDEANFGIDLPGEIGRAATDAHARSIEGKIRNELCKDEQIETVDVTLVRSVDGPAVAYDITIEAKTAAGPFQLVLSVSAVSVQLVGLTEGT